MNGAFNFFEEGSGEAIHLAASRGNVNIIKPFGWRMKRGKRLPRMLLKKKASLTATVSRASVKAFRE